jgi:nicotinate-nucleotide adenylyltransferase
MKRIALFFGSFNPIHKGHIGIGQAALDQQKVDEVHYILTPQNPHKNTAVLLSEEHRWKMLVKALAPYDGLVANDIELHMPKPNYTAHTLQKLTTANPEHSYIMLMGADSATGLDAWKNAAFIKQFPLLIYPRNDISLDAFTAAQRLEAPLLDVSATRIRKTKDMLQLKEWLPDEVIAYMQAHQLVNDI